MNEFVWLLLAAFSASPLRARTNTCLTRGDLLLQLLLTLQQQHTHAARLGQIGLREHLRLIGARELDRLAQCGCEARWMVMRKEDDRREKYGRCDAIMFCLKHHNQTTRPRPEFCFVFSHNDGRMN